MAFGVAAKGIRGRLLWLVALLGFLIAPLGQAASPAPSYKVGMREVDWSDGGRPMVMTLFYPAEIADPAAKPTVMPFFVNLQLYRDAPVASGDKRYPLVMLSHGRGSNGLVYAWFAEYLASRGYVVAALNHYRANTYDSSIVYLTNKIWQRPLDIALDITWLLKDPVWSQAYRRGTHRHRRAFPGRIHLALGRRSRGQSRALHGRYQRNWRNNLSIPQYLRDEMPVDAAPALHLRDARVKAAFAMAPGIIQAFGMDAQSLAKMAVPAYLIVGAADTQTPPAENAAFAAKYIPQAELNIIPGRVDHEIFTNECDQEGKDNFPESCIDAPGVDRHQLHEMIGAAALTFFDRNLDVQRPQ